MQVREQNIDGLLIIFLQGRLDRTSAPALEHQLMMHIESGQRAVLVDCTDLRLVSADGLGALWGACGALRRSNGRMAICNLVPPLAELMRIAGLLRYLPLHPNKAEAVQTLRQFRTC